MREQVFWGWGEPGAGPSLPAYADTFLGGELGLPGGHIGVFVSGKSQGIVGKGIVDWLARRD